ncbi:GAF domain-containing protein [Mangrovivirga sp. M17]|uniref:GAF domain-containing protein n=1 Tax=Mangrovivirga halotolerans TaxID=2993936 RepID=A0ABT3RQL2_9BACT|nr:GAF domain-containing protein [Mangrovivirga halotolerans]MCX2744077.1 GAF domain-containing protein [Mangrovivirga halotolerans]
MRMTIKRKLLFIILGIFLLAFVGSVSYIILTLRGQTVKEAKNLARSYTNQNTNEIRAIFNKDFGISRAAAGTLEEFSGQDLSVLPEITDKMLVAMVERDQRYFSAWVSYELSHYDTAYYNDYGRARRTAYQTGGFKSDTLELEGNNEASDYFWLKTNGVEELANPYVDQDLLMTSVCIPLKNDNNKFIGLIGIDVILSDLQFISGLKPYEEAQTILFSSNGSIVAHENSDFVGKDMDTLFGDWFNKDEVLRHVKNNGAASYEKYLSSFDDEVIINFRKIDFGGTAKPWYLATFIPKAVIIKDINEATRNGIIIALLGFIILAVVLYYLSDRISSSLKKASDTLDDLSKGKVSEGDKLQIKTNDELNEMSKSINTLIDNLGEKSEYARAIGEGNLDYELDNLDENDVLGKALVEMKFNLRKSREEEEKRNWVTKGQAHFSDMLRIKSGTDLKEFFARLLKDFVDYVEVNQAGIFLLNDDDSDNLYLELVSAYAFDRRKYLNKNIQIGEGLVGQSYLEKKPIYLTDVPEEYVNIKSGLGDATPRCVLIMPLVENENVLGVLEIASFKVLPDHHLELIEKLGESLAATIGALKMNERTKELLEQTKEQAEMMRSQEEEMRQNMEELQATQEEMARRQKESDLQNEELKRKLAEKEKELDSVKSKVND